MKHAPGKLANTIKRANLWIAHGTNISGRTDETARLESFYIPPLAITKSMISLVPSLFCLPASNLGERLFSKYSLPGNRCKA
jgi:hypothetical protein